MSYSTSAPPILMTQPVAGIRTWYHTSADATTAVDASGFITNGGALGMKVNDIVYHDDSTTDATAITVHKVVTVSSTYPGAVDLSDGTVVGSATNSD
jgi:uncharacterized protein YwbE